MANDESKITRNEFVEQYTHTWRVFEGIVNDFDNDAWIHTGRGIITPVRLAFHILQAVKYYIEDSTTIVFASGKSFESDWETVEEESLPSQDDILMCTSELKAKTKEWLSEMDLNSQNTSFGWAGETRLGVALFLLRHSVYHLGELSSLLNESINGEARDNYVKAL